MNESVETHIEFARVCLKKIYRTTFLPAEWGLYFCDIRWGWCCHYLQVLINFSFARLITIHQGWGRMRRRREGTTLTYSDYVVTQKLNILLVTWPNEISRVLLCLIFWSPAKLTWYFWDTEGYNRAESRYKQTNTAVCLHPLLYYIGRAKLSSQWVQ